MSLHIIASYSKKFASIGQEVTKRELLLELAQKYVNMIGNNKEQFDTLDKQVVYELLLNALIHLLRPA